MNGYSPYSPQIFAWMVGTPSHDGVTEHLYMAEHKWVFLGEITPTWGPIIPLRTGDGDHLV